MFTPAQLNQFFKSSLSEVVQYNDGSTTRSIQAVVDLSFRGESFEDAEVESNDPSVWIKTADAPDLDVLQVFTIQGKSFAVESFHDQGDGTTLIQLEPTP